MTKIKLNTVAIALMLGMGLTSLSVVSCKTDGPTPTIKPEVKKEVTFADAELAKLVKTELKLKETDKIMESDLLKLKKLVIRGKSDKVANLKGLEKALELTELDFGGTAVKDIAPIKDLKKVTYLRMNNTQVEDLKPISNYSTLTYFNANTAKSIKDISPLAKNVNLKELILREAPIGDKGLETIKLFTKLHRLNLRSTGITTVVPIAELMSKGALLKKTAGYVDGDSELDLRGNSIKDYSPLDKYAKDAIKITK